MLVPQSHHCRGRKGSLKVLRNKMEPENHPDTNSIGGGSPGVWERGGSSAVMEAGKNDGLSGVLGKEGEKSSFSDSAS